MVSLWFLCLVLAGFGFGLGFCLVLVFVVLCFAPCSDQELYFLEGP